MAQFICTFLLLFFLLFSSQSRIWLLPVPATVMARLLGPHTKLQSSPSHRPKHGGTPAPHHGLSFLTKPCGIRGGMLWLPPNIPSQYLLPAHTLEGWEGRGGFCKCWRYQSDGRGEQEVWDGAGWANSCQSCMSQVPSLHSAVKP